MINAYDDVVSSGGGGTGAQGGAGTGGAPTTTSTMTTMSSAMSGGGGMGGMAPTYACQPFGPVVDVMSPADLGNTTELAEDVLVAYDQDGNVHVIVTNQATRQIIARTVRDDELGPLVMYPPGPGTQDNRAFDVMVFPNTVRVLANMAGSFTQLDYAKNNGKITPSAPTEVALPIPTECTTMGAQHDRLWGAVDTAEAYVLGACRSNGTMTVFGTNLGTNAVRFQYSGPENDPKIRPQQYLRVGGVNVLVCTGENPGAPGYGAFVRFGSDGQIPNRPTEIILEDGKQTFPFAVVPGLGPDPSVFAVLASLNGMSPTFTPATLFSGVITGADLPMLAMNPGMFLTPALEFASQSQILFTTPPNQAFQQFVSAGINIFDPASSKVMIQWWDPEGKLLTNSLINEITDPNTEGRHTFAAAGRGNQVFYYVVWARQDSMSRFMIQAQRASCDVVAP